MTTPLLFRNARVLTLAGTPGARRGRAMHDLGVLDRADVLVRGGRVAAVGAGLDPGDARVVEAHGRVLMPAFVDAHTHACWAGSRLDEWEAKLAGATYLELLARGGGIMSTVRAVRAATREALRDGLLDRLHAMAREGTAAVEVKSGYGLTTPDELKMLDAIADAHEHWPGQVTQTACIGHALDPEHEHHAERTIEETLPAVHHRYPGIALDAYCEKGAWSLEQCQRLFAAGRRLGHPVRVHADQFNPLGMVEIAIEMNAVSVDHLEATPPESLDRLAHSETFGVMLPCSGFHLDGRYANGRRFVDAGGRLVLATNCNPGSAPCVSMPMVIALAVRHLGLSVPEAICATTINAAALLGHADCGSIVHNARADLVLLRCRDERELAYTFGASHAAMTVIAGRVVYDDGTSTGNAPG